MQHFIASVLAYAEAHPQKSAVVSAETVLCYGDLRKRVLATQHQLMMHGVGERSPVLLWCQDKVTLIIGYFALLRAGAVVVPVATGAASQTLQELAARCEAKYIFTDQAASVPESLKPLYLKVSEPESLTEDHTAEAQVIMFTSGTTAQKKGVVLGMETLQAATAHINATIDVCEDTVEYICVPLYHSFGIGRVRCVLSRGGTVVVDNGLFNPARLLQAIPAEGVNALSFVPAVFKMFEGKLQSFLSRVGAGIKHIEMGSAAMSPEDKKRVIEIFPHAEVWMHYGLTEASRSTFLNLRRDDLRLDSVGQPAPGVEVCILSEQGELCAPGQLGEVVIKGPHVALAYYNDPLRSEAMQHRYGFRSGDWGYMDEAGYLYLKGRKDEVINHGGVKIAPLEVEAAIRPLLEGFDYAICGIADTTGQAGQIPVLVVASEQPLPWRLDGFLSQATAYLDSNLQPKRLMRLPQIPRTANGKVKRQELTKILELLERRGGQHGA